MVTNRTWWLRLLCAALVTMVVGAGMSTPAFAHNQLSSSTPPDGSRLDQAPSTVTLDFLDTLVPANTTVLVTGPDAAPAAAGPPTFDGSEVTVPLAASYAGRYTVAYEVLASDGHLGTGEITFDLTTEAAPAPPAGAAVASPTPAADAGPPDWSAAGSNGSTGWWPWVAVAAGVAVLAGLAAVVVLRLRRRAGPAGGA